MKTIIFILISTIAINSATLRAQSSELKEALGYLNNVRANPDAYSGEIGVSLKGIQAMHPLKWDSTLAVAAQRKAEDMANRNYFGHVDPEGYGMNYFIQKSGYALDSSWLNDKSNNYFESLDAGTASPKASIIDLINDNNERVNAKAGHRLHLLAITDFYKECYDIGIGWASNKNSTYKNYCSVLIAKHKY